MTKEEIYGFMLNMEQELGIDENELKKAFAVFSNDLKEDLL